MAEAAYPGQIVLEQELDVAVVRLLGEHDLATLPLLEEAVNASLASAGSLVVDVGETQFMDAACLGVLARADEMLRLQGTGLVLQYGTPSAVRRVFELTGLHERFLCADSRRQAIEMARERP